MKNYFPKQPYNFVQSNYSDRLGSLWSSFNLDFKKKLGSMMLSKKLVTTTTSTDDADLGLPIAFEFWNSIWWSICGSRIFKTASGDPTGAFSEDTVPSFSWSIGASDTEFDVVKTGSTCRYTYDNITTNPFIYADSVPVGATVTISAGTTFSAGNKGTFTVTASGTNYFEVTNAGGLSETDKTISSGSIVFSGNILGRYFTYSSDLKVFNANLYATDSYHLWEKVDKDTYIAWEAVDTTIMGRNGSKLCYFKKHDRLYYFVDVNSTGTVGIRSINTDGTVAREGNYFINLGNSVKYGRTMVASTQHIWIGSIKDLGNQGYGTAGANSTRATISQWDGYQQQVTNEYEIDAASILGMTVVGDIPYALDSNGKLLKFNGISFVEVEKLPLGDYLLKNVSTVGSSQIKPMHPNGMLTTKENTILFNISNEHEDGTITENIPSGVWEYDPSTGSLSHAKSFTLKPIGSATITDYGQNRISEAGALRTNQMESESSAGRVELLAGARYFTDATTTKYGIFVGSPLNPTTEYEGQKRGYFVTSWIEAQDIVDNFVSASSVYKRFLNSTDKMILKYRLDADSPTYATITWTSTTTFTTTTNISAYDKALAPFNGTSGGEVEVIQGTGAGSCTHISTITENAGTYTVTLENAVTGVTGTAKARFQKWVKLLPETIGQVLSYAHSPIAKSGTKIQIKGVLEFTGDDEFYKMVVFSKPTIGSDI